MAETVDEFRKMIPEIIVFATNLMIAILILVIGSYLIRWIKKGFNRSFERMEMEISLKKFLLSLINAVLYGIVGFMALERVGVSSASIIAVLGSAGLALGLALQGSLSNFAGGVLILIMKPFKVGDYILCENSFEGTVAVIGLVYTTLNTADNRTVVIPNGNLANSTLVNVTAQQVRRVDLNVGIRYDADLQNAKSVLEKMLAGHMLILKEHPIQVFVSELAAGSVILGVRGWVKTEDYWTVKWELTELIKILFDQEGIKIPNNQMDIHLIKEDL